MYTQKNSLGGKLCVPYHNCKKTTKGYDFPLSIPLVGCLLHNRSLTQCLCGNKFASFPFLKKRKKNKGVDIREWKINFFIF